MKKFAALTIAGVVAGGMALWGLSPAQGIILHGSQARMTGGGWVAIGDAEDAPGPDAGRARLTVGLPCLGADVGFNPQPDPPGRPARLSVKWGAGDFRLTELDASRCSLGGPDTLEGTGAGVCNGQRATVAFRLTDGGGRAGIGNPDIHPDTVRVEVSGATAACSLSLDGPLVAGNIHMIGDPTDG